MQEDVDIETHYKGHRWEGEMLDSDSEEGEHKQEQQQLMKLHSPGLIFSYLSSVLLLCFLLLPFPTLYFELVISGFQMLYMNYGDLRYLAHNVSYLKSEDEDSEKEVVKTTEASKGIGIEMYFTQVVEVETRESSADTNIIDLGGSLVAARDQQPSSSPLLVTPAAYVSRHSPHTTSTALQSTVA
ncbi:unnamed protein product [Sphagnum jensenii]|uniref:Uncharacterized protein n=1 Tax=Sphagnum jensenii TaxID=128206 RepID=A0ABP1AGT2_9BRYO